MQARGAGMSVFLPTPLPEVSAVPLARRPTLVMCYDEGSPNVALAQWLQYRARLRVICLRDPFLREWNDVTNALRAVGLWDTVLLSTVCFNLPHGPWNGQALRLQALIMVADLCC